VGAGQRVLLEFVSANPTGPLHVGHGRGAAYGATVANLLRGVGFEVDNEYYVNDAGRQMDILATSVYLRYVETQQFPDNGAKSPWILSFEWSSRIFSGIFSNTPFAFNDTNDSINNTCNCSLFIFLRPIGLNCLRPKQTKVLKL
jgi:hypothetical protein